MREKGARYVCSKVAKGRRDEPGSTPGERKRARERANERGHFYKDAPVNPIIGASPWLHRGKRIGELGWSCFPSTCRATGRDGTGRQEK